MSQGEFADKLGVSRRTVNEVLTEPRQYPLTWLGGFWPMGRNSGSICSAMWTHGMRYTSTPRSTRALNHCGKPPNKKPRSKSTFICHWFTDRISLETFQVTKKDRQSIMPRRLLFIFTHSINQPASYHATVVRCGYSISMPLLKPRHGQRQAQRYRRPPARHFHLWCWQKLPYH